MNGAEHRLSVKAVDWPDCWHVYDGDRLLLCSGSWSEAQAFADRLAHQSVAA